MVTKLGEGCSTCPSLHLEQPPSAFPTREAGLGYAAKGIWVHPGQSLFLFTPSESLGSASLTQRKKEKENVGESQQTKPTRKGNVLIE